MAVGINPNRKDKKAPRTRKSKKNGVGGPGGAQEGAGRIPKFIDWSVVDKYLIAGCSASQIGPVIGVDQMTLYRRCQQDLGIHWDEYRMLKLEKGNAGLLGKQYTVAMEGDIRMLIHLGKHRLGQIDKIEQNVTQTVLTTQKAILKLPDNGRRGIKKDE
jgi:hypothetical protein